jgi:serine protease Do
MRPLLLAAVGAAGLTACSTLTGGAATAPTAELERLTDHVADLVEQLAPGLVQIRAAPDPGQRPRPAAAGFLVGPGGLILTVAHAVPGGDRVEIELADGRRVPGTVIGRDSRSDLAAVKIDDPGHLHSLRFGDSDRVRAGQFVLALGHPYGLKQAVSLGIVSGKGPPPEGGLPDFEFVHTDALVNPGNSGGPLVNLAGEVIGVNTWAARNGSMGIAVPSDLAKLVLPRLVADGRVDWGWLGVSVAEARPADFERLGLHEEHGLLIRDVEPGGPAEQAGLRADDLVVAVDGERVARPCDLHRLIMATPGGRQTQIVLVREGQRREVGVTVRPYGDVGTEAAF